MNRDRSLDIFKGIACILMILAHATTFGNAFNDHYTWPFYYLGFFAPVLFFAGVSTSLHYQKLKRTKFQILLIYLMLCIMSIADNGRSFADYFVLNRSNLILLLSFSAIATMFLDDSRYIPLYVILIFALNKFLYVIGLPYNLLFGYLFSPIPWLAFMLVGNYLIEKKYYILPTFIISSLASIITFFVIKRFIQSQDVTLLFAEISFAMISFGLFISPYLQKIKYISDLLSYFGEYSLLFFWTHYLIIYLLPQHIFAPIEWVILLIGSYLLMRILNVINRLSLAKISELLGFWIVLIIIIPVPMIFHFSDAARILFFYFILLVFALNYHNFSRVIIPRFTQQRTAPSHPSLSV